jgi:NitT/TauT family transport system substrate-binding protein
MRRWILAGAIAASTTLSIASASAATQIVLLYTGASSIASAYVAKDQHFFDKRGLDVELTITANGSTIPAALVGDSAQIGIPTPTVLLQANESGLDLVSIAGAEAFPTPTRMALMARPSAGIKNAADFAGKKIGVPGLNGVIDLMTRKWIAANGGDPGKASFIEVAIPAGPDMLQTGQVDAVASIDPFIQRIEAAKTATAIGELNSVVPDGAYGVTYVTTRRWATKNAEAVKAFRAALEEANAFAKDPKNLASLRQSISTYTKLPMAVVETLPLPPNLDASNRPEGMRFWIDLALENKMISKAPDPATLLAP